MKTLYIASNNQGKVNELQRLLPCEVKTPKSLGIVFEPEETGTTFEENALIKARALFEIVHAPVVSDDSGLCVDALNGAPGILSARYSGGGDEENNDLLLKNLKGVSNRAAHFVSAFAYVDDTHEFTVRGECHGSILTERIGNNNFGYDPIFFSDDLQMSFGEAPQEAKNKVSHRARAVAALIARLKTEGLV